MPSSGASYGTVDLIDPVLGGEDGKNYELAPVKDQKLKSPVNIGLGLAPKITVNYDVTPEDVNTDKNTFDCTLEIAGSSDTGDNASTIKYMYSMDGSEPQESPVFAYPAFVIEPGSTHVFEAYAVGNDNIKSSETGTTGD